MADNQTNLDNTEKSIDQLLHRSNDELTQIQRIINDVSEKSSYGNIANNIGRAFYGFNHRGIPGLIPINKDYHGLTFFTRPDLNLSEGNLRTDRKMTRLLAGADFSMERIIRCTLDPHLTNGITNEGVQVVPMVRTPDFIDNKQAFIPILTNTLLSLPGWPDDSNATFSSEPGVYGEVYGFIDGPPDILGTYDLTANFRNIIGDPITKMFYYWSRYAKLVHEGMRLVPYGENIVENRIDYNTRIYRLVLDETKQFVTEISACGASFPLSSPTGAKFNFESDKPLNDNNDQISIPFRCFGFIVYDDILIKEFNEVVCEFNPAMKDDKRETSSGYIKIPLWALQTLNNYGYPRIDPYTRELEWWVHEQSVFGHFFQNDDDIRMVDPYFKRNLPGETLPSIRAFGESDDIGPANSGQS